MSSGSGSGSQPPPRGVQTQHVRINSQIVDQKGGTTGSGTTHTTTGSSRPSIISSSRADGVDDSEESKLSYPLQTPSDSVTPEVITAALGGGTKTETPPDEAVSSSSDMSIQRSPSSVRSSAAAAERVRSPPSEVEWNESTSPPPVAALPSPSISATAPAGGAPMRPKPKRMGGLSTFGAPADATRPTENLSVTAVPTPPATPNSGAANPASSSSSSSMSAAAASKRKAMVAQFIRSGESNIVFREKAPSIVPNETGLFLAPPSKQALARQEREREREQSLLASSSGYQSFRDTLGHGQTFGERIQAGSFSERAGFMPIPLAGLGASSNERGSGGNTPVNAPAGTSNSPRRYSGMSSSPMGMSSRQLMFQLSSSASLSQSAQAAMSAAVLKNDEKTGKHRRTGSNAGAGGSQAGGSAMTFPSPRFFGSGETGGGLSSDDSTPSSPHLRPSRFTLRGSDSKESLSGLRATSASPARGRSPFPGERGGTAGTPRGSAGGRPGSATNRGTGRSARAAALAVVPGGGGDSADSEEARRLAEEREANMLAPFLEARGNEDFVTYDLTRQEDYHKKRKEMTREKFARWAKAYKRKSKPHPAHQHRHARGSDAAVELEDEDDTSKAGGGAPGGGDPSSSSSDDDAFDNDESMRADDYDDPAARRRRKWKNAKRCMTANPVIRFLLKACILGQSWIICALIGVITGLLAAVIDLAVQWLIDLKSGYCTDALYLSNSFCCAGSRDWVGGSNNQPLLLMCQKWHNWDNTYLFTDTLSSLISPFFAAYVMYVLLGVCMASLAAWLVLYFAPHAAGSGIPEIITILGGVVVKKYLGGWTLLIKCIALVLSVGAGLSLGKEGGFVHIACCVANILCRYFPEFKNNQYKKNEAISAASAAGISVAFGAPVGGVLFSLEVASSYFPHKTMWRAFFCAIIASLVLQSIDPYQEGRLVLFFIDYNKSWYWFEMVPFAFIGVMGGVLGALFIRLNTRITAFRKSSIIQQYPILEVATVAFVTVLIKYLSAYLRGNNNAVLASLFGDCKEAPVYDPLAMCDTDGTAETIAALLFTSVATFFLTTITWSLCVPGGVFVPALIIGASFGRVVGTLMRTWQMSSSAPSLFDGCSPFTPGIYALVGAACMLGGVTRMTVCLVVVMFEITGGLNYLLPIMVGLMFSKLVGDAFDRRSIFEAHLILNKYPFLNSKDRIPPKIRVSDAMSRDLLALPMHGHTVESLTDQLALLGELRITGFPIVTTLKDRFIVGYINRSELYTALSLALRNPSITPQTRCYFAMLSLRFPRNDPYVDLRPWLHPSPIQVVEHTPLYRVHDMFKKMGLRYVLVTNFGKLVGVLTKKDILDILARMDTEKHSHPSKKRSADGTSSLHRLPTSSSLNDYPGGDPRRVKNERATKETQATHADYTAMA